jgi:hypothetical protein
MMVHEMSAEECRAFLARSSMGSDSARNHESCVIPRKAFLLPQGDNMSWVDQSEQQF